MNYCDAHNHLQDDRLADHLNELVSTCARTGIARMVVNGTCEADWPRVLALARHAASAKDSAAPARGIQIIPSFGYHPWYLARRTPEWLEHLEHYLTEIPSAVGEIGLDRWKPDLPYAGQEAAFVAQLRLAADRNLPVSIHCLQAWGRLLELLRSHPRPERGFLLHSFGGPAELIPELARLGAYFSFPGYFLQARKERQREIFKAVPPDRLLIETDAPDQSLPPENIRHPLTDRDGKPLNHPANLKAVYAGLAKYLGEDLDTLAARVEHNFQRVFA
ncbi:MAG: TatD family hydrolase [Verrucomicrobiota bacterium]